MTDSKYEKDFGPVDAARERSGIYGFGFDPVSLKGFILPFIAAGGAITAALLIYFLL
ncbi:hypothetical protein BH23CHL5_BH23CHL5_27460 [soil metagenome]